MSAPCYCCSSQEGISRSEVKSSEDLDLDSALNQLGMLSTVTESHKNYILENAVHSKRKSAKDNPFSYQSGLCVVQMNSTFVTRFSFTKPSSVTGSSSGDIERKKQHDNRFSSKSLVTSQSLEVSTSSVPFHRVAKMRNFRNRNHFYRPYDFPWRIKLEESFQSQNQPCAPSTDNPEVSSKSPTIPRQDSGNKSNPGSPVKNQKGTSTPGCSIFRSRSLDNLDIGRLQISEIDKCSTVTGPGEIETVSQGISNMHVG